MEWPKTISRRLPAVRSVIRSASSWRENSAAWRSASYSSGRLVEGQEKSTGATPASASTAICARRNSASWKRVL